jgi:serine/threonine protein kinase
VIEMRKKKRKRLNDLKHELYVLERMEHAHIVKLYEHFIIDERVYIFMECASGGTLSEHVRRRGPLRELRARRWFKQICSAVHHMHARGISHRDLKLGNILLDEQKQCKVTDFGLSRVSYRSAQGILYCSSYCGTEPYMAPEILKKDEMGKRCYDPLIADIWALGVCLYAMINKAYPFNPEDKETMVANQLQRKWKFVKKQRYRLSGEVKDLVRHMLEPDPKKRITFLGIASHPWLTEQLADLGSSFEDSPSMIVKSTIKHISAKESKPVAMSTVGKSKAVTPIGSAPGSTPPLAKQSTGKSAKLPTKPEVATTKSYMPTLKQPDKK